MSTTKRGATAPRTFGVVDLLTDHVILFNLTQDEAVDLAQELRAKGHNVRAELVKQDPPDDDLPRAA